MIQNAKKRTIYSDARQETGEFTVLEEHILSIVIHETPVFRLVCTKNHLRELVTGRLFTEGLIGKKEDIYKILFCKSESEADVFLNHELVLEESREAEPTCCAGNIVYHTPFGGRRLKRIECAWEGEPDPGRIFRLTEYFARDTELHALTQSTHSCILEKAGEVLFSCEDIGRHNTVDKAVGFGLLNGVLPQDCILYTSGRVPVDMVQKVIASGIPVLVSKSVPTAESVALAKEYGLTLIGRAHRDSYEIY